MARQHFNRIFGLCLIVCAAFAVLPVFVAGAATNNEDSAAQAKHEFQRGKALFKQRHYDEALVALSKAYELKPHSALLKYMAQCAYKAGNLPLAIQYFERYVSGEPQAADRATIEAKVGQLKKELAQIEARNKAGRKAGASATTPKTGDAAARDSAQTPPLGSENPLGAAPGVGLQGPLGGAPMYSGNRTPEAGVATSGTPSEAAGSAAWMHAAKWSTLGIGVGTLALGVVFSVFAQNKSHELEQSVKTSCPIDQPACGGNPNRDVPLAPITSDQFSMQSAYKRDRFLSILFYAIGGAATAASITLFFIDREPSYDVPLERTGFSFAPEIGPGRYVLQSTLRF